MNISDTIAKYELENSKIWAIRKMSKDLEIVRYFNCLYPSYVFKHQYCFYCKGLDTEPLCLNCQGVLNTPDTATYCSHKCRANHEIKTGKIKERQAKQEQTKLEKYGDRHYYNKEKHAHSIQSRSEEEKDDALNKKRKTCVERYGTESFSNTLEFIKKSKKTKTERYDDPTFSNRVKAKHTTMCKYGVSHHMHVDEIKNKVSKRLSAPNHLNVGVLNNRDELIRIYNEHGIIGVSDILNSSVPYANRMLRRLSIDVVTRKTSKFEDEIDAYINSLGHPTTRNNRSMLNGKEIDIYIPDKCIAIECNGVYWHAHENNTAKSYHYKKTDLCKEIGVQLIHITDIQWDTQQDIVKSRIKSLLSMNNKVFARKCTIENLSSATTKQFLNDNHIQGSCPSSVRYGLFYEGELIGVMTFGKSRFNKNVEWELIRYCTKQGLNITGGASRLLSKFLNSYTGSIISYSNRDWNTGKLYQSIGFEYLKTSPANVFYTRDFMVLESRHAFQAHKLKNKLETYNSEVSAKENIQSNKYFSYYDSGNDVWIYRR